MFVIANACVDEAITDKQTPQADIHSDVRTVVSEKCACFE